MNALLKSNIQEVQISDLRDEYNELPPHMRKVSFNFWLSSVLFGQLERDKDLLGIDVMEKGKRKYRLTIGRLKIVK